MSSVKSGLMALERLRGSVREGPGRTAVAYAVLGVAYAVLLGLMVVAVWEQWEAAKVTADNEASSLAEIF